VKPWVPQATTVDEYGQHAGAFMRRMIEIGVDPAIAAEIDTPRCDDPGWCRMVVELAARRAIKKAGAETR